jgi:prepilin-type N-terminal cleavage/methylation domain-containing protein
MRKKNGYTLIELMLAITIISVLSSIAIPKFVDLIRKSREATTLGYLGALRAAVSIYYSDNEGMYPDTLETVTVGSRYLASIPYAWTQEYGFVNLVTNTR